jgi:hypothetical protein
MFEMNIHNIFRKNGNTVIYDTLGLLGWALKCNYHVCRRAYIHTPLDVFTVENGLLIHWNRTICKYASFFLCHMSRRFSLDAVIESSDHLAFD